MFGVPRAFRDHRRLAARTYRAAVSEIAQRLGLDLNGRSTTSAIMLREYGRLVVELEELGREAERLSKYLPRKRREGNRISRRRMILRRQLLTLEQRLEEQAKARPVGTLRGLIESSPTPPSTSTPPSTPSPSPSPAPTPAPTPSPTVSSRA